jgi:hypothetical protein
MFHLHSEAFDQMMHQNDIEGAEEILQLMTIEATNEEQRNKCKQSKQLLLIAKQKSFSPSPLPSSTSIKKPLPSQKTNTVETLKRSLEQLLESEQNAENSLNELGIQEEKVQNMRQKVSKTQGNLDTSNKLLSRMSKFWR